MTWLLHNPEGVTRCHAGGATLATKPPLGFAPTRASRHCEGGTTEANRRFNEVNPGMSLFFLDCFVPRNDAKRLNGRRKDAKRQSGAKRRIRNAAAAQHQPTKKPPPKGWFPSFAAKNPPRGAVWRTLCAPRPTAFSPLPVARNGTRVSSLEQGEQ
jgi:hypothetical protein